MTEPLETRHTEQVIWDTILYKNGIPNRNIITILNMPSDSSCFYHALYNGLCYLPNQADADAVNTFFETYHQKLVNFIKNIDSDTTELDIPHPDDINYTHIIRFIIAIHIKDSDFEKYQLLCIAEPENHIYEDIRKLRTGMLLNLNNDYANIVTINIIRRVLQEQAGVDIGIYIYCVPDALNRGGLTSDSEWHEKPYNIFFELVYNIHYNLIKFHNLEHTKGGGIVLTPRQIRKVYWSKPPQPTIAYSIEDDDIMQP